MTIQAPPSSPFVAVGIASLALLVAALIVLAVAWSGRRLSLAPRDRRRRLTWVAGGLGLWLTATAVLAHLGYFADLNGRPPPFAVLVISVIAIASAFAFSRAGSQVAHGLPLAALVGFHAFRLPLELVMHRASTEGIMPVQMSFSGLNFDIVTGITALGLGLFLLRRPASRGLLLAWNILGSCLLLVVVGIAISSTPVFAAFGTDALNTWVMFFPYVWLPASLVAAALAGHLILFRRLMVRSKPELA